MKLVKLSCSLMPDRVAHLMQMRLLGVRYAKQRRTSAGRRSWRRWALCRTSRSPGASWTVTPPRYRPRHELYIPQAIISSEAPFLLILQSIQSEHQLTALHEHFHRCAATRGRC